MENQKSEKVKEFDPIASLANNRYSLGNFNYFNKLSLSKEEETPGFFVSSVRKAIENVDDPEFKDKYGKYIPFFQVIIIRFGVIIIVENFKLSSRKTSVH